jgi:ABC-type transporter Mla MlaB component
MKQHPEILRLEGPLTIKTISGVKDSLMASLARARSTRATVLVDISDTAETDLTLPQLLLAARNYAEREGLKLALKAPAAGPFLSILERAGLVTGTAAQNSFWLQGENA